MTRLKDATKRRLRDAPVPAVKWDGLPFLPHQSMLGQPGTMD